MIDVPMQKRRSDDPQQAFRQQGNDRAKATSKEALLLQKIEKPHCCKHEQRINNRCFGNYTVFKHEDSTSNEKPSINFGKFGDELYGLIFI